MCHFKVRMRCFYCLWGMDVFVSCLLYLMHVNTEHLDNVFILARNLSARATAIGLAVFKRYLVFSKCTSASVSWGSGHGPSVKGPVPLTLPHANHRILLFFRHHLDVLKDVSLSET